MNINEAVKDLDAYRKFMWINARESELKRLEWNWKRNKRNAIITMGICIGAALAVFLKFHVLSVAVVLFLTFPMFSWNYALYSYGWNSRKYWRRWGSVPFGEPPQDR